MPDIYQTPESNLITEANSKTTENIFVSVLILFFSVPLLYALVYVIPSTIGSLLSLRYNPENENTLFLDAASSALVITVYYWIIFTQRPKHAKYICIGCGLILCLYFEYSNTVLYYPLSTPDWYLLNIKYNEFLIAVLLTGLNYLIIIDRSLKIKIVNGIRIKFVNLLRKDLFDFIRR